MARSEHEPDHDTDYGYITEEIRLHGVGEFHPESVAPDTPVFHAETDAGSYITFAFLPDDVEDPYMRVFHAHSEEKGEFSTLMDTVLRHFQGTDPEAKTVVFANVVSEMLPGDNLGDVLDGFESYTTEVVRGPDAYVGDEIEELVGVWDP